MPFVARKQLLKKTYLHLSAQMVRQHFTTCTDMQEAEESLQLQLQHLLAEQERLETERLRREERLRR